MNSGLRGGIQGYALLFGGLLLHVQIFSIAWLPITIPWLAMPLVILTTIRPSLWVSGRDIIILFFVVSLPLLSAIFAQEFVSFSFLRSAGLFWVFCLFFLCIHWESSSLSAFVRKRGPIIALFSLIYAFVTIYQSVSFNFFDNYDSAVILGPFQRVGPGGVVYEPYIGAPIKKVSGMLSEPSAAAWVHAALFALVFMLVESVGSFKFSRLSLVASAIAMPATLSFSGFLNVALIGVGVLIVKRKLSLVFMVCVVIALVYGAASQLDFGSHALGRVERVNDQGNSLYYRLVAPVLLISDSLAKFPLGVPLGDTSFVEGKSYMVNADGGSSTNLDNFPALIIYHFGFVGILLILVWFGYVVRSAFELSPKLIGYLSITLIGLETGAMWNPSTYVLIGLIGVLILSFPRSMAEGFS